jgi:phenylacetate-CoA ligase
MRGREAIEDASTSELRALQLDRLRRTLERAYARVPHYRAAFDGAGVAPDHLKSLADLRRFPFTTKDDLRRNYPYGILAVPMEEIARIHASSGTTGKPTVVGYSKADLTAWSQLMARSIRAAGGRPGDKMHIAYGYGLFTGGLGFHYGAEALGCAVIPVSGGFTERQAQLIADFAPDIIAATPSYLLAITDELERKHLVSSSLRLALCGAEPWSEGMRNEIERRLGVKAYDTYGLSEVIGPGVAQECAGDDPGPTIWEDHFLPEVIDPESGHPLADGEEGELVLTSLSKEAMPVIRYRTRDLTRILPPTTRPMRRMARIKGRSDDMLIIRGVNVFPLQIEAVLAAEDSLAPHYLLEITRPQRLDQLDVVVELRHAFAGQLTGDAHTALERRAEHLIKAHVGVTASVRVVPPETLERSQGKAKRVIDKRPRG